MSTTADDLRDYQQHRLALADRIRAALYVARSRKDTAVEKDARVLLARLAEDRLRLAVAGQFSRGRTTLMNAILGGSYLPTGALPMTSVVTTVTYGSVARATVRRRDAALPIDVPIAQLAEYVARSGSRRSVLQVTGADVEVPADVLRLGFAFVDTPGVGSEDAASTATTRQYLPEADAAVFVTGFDSPLTSAELAFLSELQQRFDRLFVVINKRDLVAPEQAAEVEHYVRARLAERGLDDQPIHSLSALRALDARESGDESAVAESGLDGLETELLGFLTKEKSRFVLDHAAARAEGLVVALDSDLRLGDLGADAKVAAAIGSRIDTQVAGLEVDLQHTVEILARTFDAALSSLRRARPADWRADLRSRLIAPAEEVVEDALADPALNRDGRGPDPDKLPTSLEHATRPIYEGWWERRIADVREALTGAAGEPIGRLASTARSVEVITRRAAGLTDRRSGDDEGWSISDIPSLSIAAPAWTVPLELGRRARRRGPTGAEIRAAFTAGLDLAADRAVDTLQERLDAAVPRWVDRFAAAAQEQLHDAVERFRRQLGTPPAEVDRVAVADLQAALPGFRTQLRNWAERANVAAVPDVEAVAEAADDPRHGAAPTGRSATEPPATGVVACAICTRLQQTLAEELSHEQFRLATLERAQSAHAKAGGFCRLHTWEYAAMASPVGIAAGYARLAESVAVALDGLEGAEDDPSGPNWSNQAAKMVAGLVTRTDGCRVCAALARVERDQAERLARRSATSPTTSGPIAGQAERASRRLPTLCLRHLSAVLEAGPDVVWARALTDAMAVRLRRVSEDMRSFVLAREAIRRGLVTAEEAKAYEDGLRLLAGLPALARPWSHIDD